MRAYYRFKKIIAELEDPRYIVLSMRNWALHELRAGIRELFASFGRLRRSALWHDSAKGALAALEVTFNEKTLTWHPHLNILIEGKFIDQDVLAAAWRKAARDEGLILPFIEKADAGTAKELVKYITKLVEFVHIPEAVGAFIDATKRARFLRTYGCLYGLKIEDEEDSENGKDPLTACPDCGSKEVVRLRKCFSQDDVYFDGKGVLRFCEPVDPFAVSVCDG